MYTGTIFLLILDAEWDEGKGNTRTKRLRLPDSTTNFVRDESYKPPFGRFTRYTWLLNSIFYVKRVFDVEGMIQMDVTRRFIKSKKVHQRWDLYLM